MYKTLQKTLTYTVMPVALSLGINNKAIAEEVPGIDNNSNLEEKIYGEEDYKCTSNLAGAIKNVIGVIRSGGLTPAAAGSARGLISNLNNVYQNCAPLLEYSACQGSNALEQGKTDLYNGAAATINDAHPPGIEPVEYKTANTQDCPTPEQIRNEQSKPAPTQTSPRPSTREVQSGEAIREAIDSIDFEMPEVESLRDYNVPDLSNVS